jgi:hypothetical protein
MLMQSKASLQTNLARCISEQAIGQADLLQEEFSELNGCREKRLERFVFSLKIAKLRERNRIGR